MNKSSNKWILLLSMIMVCAVAKPAMTFATGMVPNTIRIGLRSAYADKASLALKSKEIEIGYETENRFIPQGSLISDTGFFMKPNQKQYYRTNDVFSTYNEAAYLAKDYISRGLTAIAVYNGPGKWGVYLDTNPGGMSLVQNNGLEIIVQDGTGKDVLLCENNGFAPAFVGKSRSQSFGLTELTGGLYRGWFEFKRQGGTLTAINIVDYEEYLYGVVAAEMPASWHMEALKAQAVAARSMSIHQRNKYLKYGYNVCDTTFTQVYKGFSGEYPRTNQAVDETRGIVVTYNGKIAETLFYSTSGGYTEDPQYVWGNPVAYLKAVPDPFETDPEGKPWTRSISLAEIDNCLSRSNVTIGKAQGIKINAYTPAGRVNELEIIGSSGSHKIKNENIRTFFAGSNGGSLRSRMFSLQNATSVAGSQSLKDLAVYRGEQAHYIMGANGKMIATGESMTVQGANGKVTYGPTTGNSNNAQVAYGTIVLSGQGYGHGVGMSQSGAKGMAGAGYTYDQIIDYYYQGVQVQR